MSDLVERLAEKENEQEVTSMRRGDRIRWWLNAIADELDDEGDRGETERHAAEKPQKFVPTTWWRCGRWLRSQATGGE